MDVLNSIFSFDEFVYDKYFLWLVWLIVGLFLLSILFAILTILLRLSNIIKAKRRSRLEKDWEPDLLEILSDDKEPSILWKNVRKRESSFFLEFLLRYAYKLKGREREIISELARPYLNQVVKETTWGKPERRAQAVEILANLGFKNFADLIIKALEDTSPLVVMIAARALARKEHSEYAKEVFKKLDRFANWNPRFLAGMLASVGPQAAPSLRGIFCNPDEALWARIMSAEALFILNDITSGDIASKVLKEDVDRELSAVSLRILEKFGRREHLAVIKALYHNSDFMIRAHVISAIASQGGAEDIKTLRAAFDDPSSWVAIRAAKGLKEVGEIGVLNEIAESLHPRAALAREVLQEEEKL